MATETAAASTTSLQVTNDDARGTLIVSASTGATPNETADVEQLRWVGSQFIYFLDIPCVEIYACPSSPSTSSDEPNETESDDPSETESDEPSGTDSSDSSSRPCIRSAEFVRTLIEGVMDMEVSMDHLERRDEAERKIISGDNLARLLVPWARGLLLEREHLALDPVHLEHGRRAKSVLLREIQAFDDAAQQVCPLDDEVLYALGTFLICVSKCASVAYGDDKAFGWLDNTRVMEDLYYVVRRRLESSWGSWMADEMERVLDAGIPFIAYATSCQPTLNKVATRTGIINLNRDPKNIPHVAPGCTCALVKPSMDAVRTSYSEDDVPAVIFDGNGLTVRPASKGPYVAISHVWADGLGSSTEHGLPLCQVARLDALVRKLVPDGAFWHDGLCVPSPKTQRPTWQRAISLLARIYAGADKVLVVDGGVRTQCSLAKPVEECLLRIATSGWAQRIWTLQEGVLARELYFEVADGLVDCSHFDGDASFITSCLIPTLRYRRHDGDSKFQRRLSQRPRCSLNDLIRLMRLRSVTCPEDEPLAIAGLLGIDAAPLAEIRNGEERMRALLLEVREVPRNLFLFGWSAKRLSIPNFTWAPASLTAVYWPGERDDVAICTEEGLLSDLTVVRFPSTVGQVCGMLRVVDTVESTFQEARSGERDSGEEFPQVFDANGTAYCELELSPRVNSEVIFNGFLTNHKPEALVPIREYAVAIVYIESISYQATLGGDTRLRCKYVGPGRVKWSTSVAGSVVSLGEGASVQATVEMTAVRVT
ncbi:hypothetical protein BD311DRAFT_780443 [Dichomitus squalens]|uniref:Heterokaryon incompatibility domain-containing protein n=1 Tax=Dichomitus squalens TaxID=114155 RepID=A0A4Q9MDF8_9APHY|nr:hypothetical protein BD311DRAFT_780443 [Dichomitus squalens]